MGAPNLVTFLPSEDRHMGGSYVASLPNHRGGARRRGWRG